MSYSFPKVFDTVNKMNNTVDADVLETIHVVMHRVRALQMKQFGAGDLGLSAMEGKALGFFSRRPGTTLSDLAEHSGRDRAQLTRLIASLKEKALLEARPDEKDGRVVRLFPSASAKAIHAKMQRRRRALAEKAVSGLSADEQAQLVGLLERVKAALTEEG
jgi:DNA-binding MarR family transcriptional regulator